METLNYLYLTLIIIVTLYFGAVTLINYFTFKRCNRFSSDLKEEPAVDVLIPARNEEKNVEKCLETILNQNYENYRVYIIDDNSEDKTWELIQKFKDHPKLTAVQSKPLPKTWKGKQHALHQLTKLCHSEYTLCCDADMTFRPDFIRFSVSRMIHLKADMISGWPRHSTKNKNTLFILPIVYLISFFLLPVGLIPKLKNRHLAFAIGQFICFRRKALDAVGGYEAIKSEINEDVFIARLLTEKKFAVYFIDAKDHISGEWYATPQAAIQGYGRVITNFFHNRTVILLAVLVFIFIYFILFPVTVVSAFVFHDWDRWILLLFYLLFLAEWNFNVYGRGFRFDWRFLFPVVTFIMTEYVFVYSLDRRIKGIGYQWKNRNVL